MKAISLSIKDLVLLSIFTLTACGGSGGSSNDPVEITDNVEIISNIAPIITSAEAVNIDENISAVVYTTTATDADGESLSFSIVSGADQTAFSINSTSGELTFIQAADFEVPNDANADGIYEVTLAASDNNGGSDQIALQLTITNINEAPIFTSAVTTSVDENVSGIVYIATAITTDADNDGLIFNIVDSADQTAFSINNTSGELTLNQAANFEVPTDANADGIYEITLEVSDNNGGSGQLNLQLTITNINEAPIFTSADTTSVDENVTEVVYIAAANDVDDDNLSFTIVDSVDQGAFSINSSSGEVNFNQVVDFEVPTDANTDGIYEVTLEVSDNNGGSDQLTLNITINDVTQLNLNVSYPTPNANLGGSVELTSVTGFFEDLEDGEVLETDISSITVNGQAADVDFTSAENLAQDSTVRWRTQIPITTAPNENTLNIELIDNSNNNQQVSQLLLNRTIVTDPESITLDSTNNRVLLVDNTLDALISINLDSGDRTIISDANNGTGTNFISPVVITLDSANNRALVIDNFGDPLIAVNLNNGDRSIISDNTGIGTNLISPAGITLDSVNNRVLIVDTILDALVAINLSNGNRTIISDENTGSGTNLIFPRAITLDSTNNRVFVVDPNQDILFDISLDSGDRNIISSNNNGTGILLGNPQGLTLDIANNRLLLIDSTLDALIAIDIDSGDRTIASDADTGTGTNLIFPVDIALDSTNNRVLVIDNVLDDLVAINLNSGDRTIVSNANPGTGTNLNSPQDITLDITNNRVLVIDNILDVLIAIDINSGDRTIISSNNSGTGIFLRDPQGIILDQANNRVLVVDSVVEALIAIDLDSGDRMIVSDGNLNGTGINLIFPRDLALDNTSNQVFVVDSSLSALVAINLDSGDRTIISDVNTGAGTNLSVPVSLTLDIANNQVLVVDNSLDALIAININNGDRTIVSDGNNGTGSNLLNPLDIVLDEKNNRGLMVDSSLNALIAINLSNGSRTIISDESTLNGSNFRSLQRITLDSTNNRVFVLNDDDLTVIDLTTGELAVTSK